MNSLEFAINMELDGCKYYREQAEKNKGNSLETVFLMLSQDEANHANALRNRLGHLACELEENDTLTKSRSIFAGLDDFDNAGVTKQLDVYQAALENERRSITLYEGLLAQATDETDKALFAHLLKQEREHCEVMEELVIHVRRPRQWVEAAEFGRRKPY